VLLLSRDQAATSGTIPGVCAAVYVDDVAEEQ